MLKIYDSRIFYVSDSLKMNFTANEIEASANNYYISATDGDSVCVWNAETKRTRLAVGLKSVNDIAFSNDSKMFGILTDDSLCIYDTRQFSLLKVYDEFKNAQSFAFHPNGKHISIVGSDTVVNILNMKDDSDRFFVDDATGGISKVTYVSDRTGWDYMVYNTNNSLVYRHIGELAPNRAKLLEDELQLRMNEWMNQNDM
jgi:WD40 repeat protein